MYKQAISNEFKSGGKITLVGHGAYQIVEKSARIAINPRRRLLLLAAISNEMKKGVQLCSPFLL
jgi:hypothetical protein